MTTDPSKTKDSARAQPPPDSAVGIITVCEQKWCSNCKKKVPSARERRQQRRGGTARGGGGGDLGLLLRPSSSSLLIPSELLLLLLLPLVSELLLLLLLTLASELLMLPPLVCELLLLASAPASSAAGSSATLTRAAFCFLDLFFSFLTQSSQLESSKIRALALDRWRKVPGNAIFEEFRGAQKKVGEKSG